MRSRRRPARQPSTRNGFATSPSSPTMPRLFLSPPKVGCELQSFLNSHAELTRSATSEYRHRSSISFSIEISNNLVQLHRRNIRSGSCISLRQAQGLRRLSSSLRHEAQRRSYISHTNATLLIVSVTSLVFSPLRYGSSNEENRVKHRKVA